jgi:hypothetical protein
MSCWISNWRSIAVSINLDRLEDDIRGWFDEGIEEMTELWTAAVLPGRFGADDYGRGLQRKPGDT